jgi:hypothetical protein
MDPMYVVNLILCIIILVLGIWGFVKTKDIVPLLIGIAFGIFGVSHSFKLAGISADFSVFLIVIRTIAYLLVVYSLYKIVRR